MLDAGCWMLDEVAAERREEGQRNGDFVFEDLFLRFCG